MERILDAPISTLMSGALHYYARSLPSVTSLVCGRCGLSIAARRVVGTSESSYAIDLSPPNLSLSKLVAVLTADAKLSIFCACSASGAMPSPIPSGSNDGTCSLPKNSEPVFVPARPGHGVMISFDPFRWQYEIERRYADHRRGCHCKTCRTSTKR